MSGKDRGRPKTSSLAALEDAAHELFLEQGYQGTSVDDIARRAGISRATFFNYCPTKSDVLWIDADRALGGLESHLAAGVSLRDALIASAKAHPHERIPLIVTQSEAMGLGSELSASAGIRIERLRAALASSALDPGDVWVVLGAIVAAISQWARRSSPREHVVQALEVNLTRIRGALGPTSVATLF